MKNIFKNRKNGIFNSAIVFVSIIALGIFAQSCSKEDDIFSNTMAVDSQQANLIASEYVELIGNQYVLNLSEKNAIALGVSKFDYNRMQTEIQETNAFIIESQKSGIEVDINDPQKVQIDIPNVRLKNGSENTSTCSFTTSGSCSVFVPSNKTKVKISFACKCFIGVCSGNIQCGGTTISYSITGISGGSTTKNLPMSNTNITVSGNTSCSDGGTISVSLE
jgi:hypothetical protein